MRPARSNGRTAVAVVAGFALGAGPFLNANLRAWLLSHRESLRALAADPTASAS